MGRGRRAVFVARGRERSALTRVSTEQYRAGKEMAPRPRHSVLDLAKIEATGFTPPDGRTALESYLADLADDRIYPRGAASVTARTWP